MREPYLSPFPAKATFWRPATVPEHNTTFAIERSDDE